MRRLAEAALAALATLPALVVVAAGLSRAQLQEQLDNVNAQITKDHALQASIEADRTSYSNASDTLAYLDAALMKLAKAKASLEAQIAALPPVPTTSEKDRALAELRAKIAAEARRQTGSMSWSFAGVHGAYGRNHNKCNVFVAEMAAAGGARVPNIRKTLHHEYPPLAGDWGDRKAVIPGWVVVTDPRPGDVVAEKHWYLDATGHCGVVTGLGKTASANSNFGGRITENDWGFRKGDHPVFWRYEGGNQP